MLAKEIEIVSANEIRVLCYQQAKQRLRKQRFFAN